MTVMLWMAGAAFALALTAYILDWMRYGPVNNTVIQMVPA